MKVMTLGTLGANNEVRAIKINTRTNSYYALTAGSRGKNQWRYEMPLGAKDYPVEDTADGIDLSNENVAVIPIKDKCDSIGNQMYLIVKDTKNTKGQIVLWTLSAISGGKVTYEIEGKVEKLGVGKEAYDQGNFIEEVPILRVWGPCTLTWTRYGSMNGMPATYMAKFDGKCWEVKSK